EYDRSLSRMETVEQEAALQTVVAEPPTVRPVNEMVEVEVVDEPLVPPPVPGSPFPPGFTPDPLPPAGPPPRKRRRRRPSFVSLVRMSLRTTILTVIFLAKGIWLTLRLSDRTMCRALGEENTILHN